MIQINCETDFVAKTEVFKKGAKAFFHTLESADDINIELNQMNSDSVKQLMLNRQLTTSLDPDLKQMTGSEGLTFLISKTRENCTIGSVFRKQLDGERLFGSYLHNKSEDYMGKLGALVIVNGAKSGKIAEALAMHITAMRPTYISKDKVPKDVEHVDTTAILENQEFVADDNEENLTVKQYLKQKGKQQGGKITVEDFVIFSCS